MTTPESLFASFLASGKAGEGIELEELCGAHPEHAAQLRELHRQWLRLDDIQRRFGLSGSLTERLHRVHGAKIDPQVELGDEYAGDFTKQLVDRLSSRTPASNRYHLKGEVGRGGMGAVLRVWDEDLRRHLAMKVMLGKREPQTSDGKPAVDSIHLARFLEEAQVTGQLDHPGIVPVHELGLDADGQVFFTMKLVNGTTLGDVFDELAAGSDNWTEVRVLGLIVKICEAMSYAHAKGVIHRDLKPANVMVGKFGEVYVMDWGLAKILGREDEKDLRVQPEAPARTSDLLSDRRDQAGQTPDSPLYTMDGDVVGTPAYMAPEQAAGRVSEMGPPSDVYALGAMLYQLMAGHMPYVPPRIRLNNYAVWQRVQEGPPRPLHELAPASPPELVAICERAMEREARARYPDVQALAADLAAYVEGRVVRAYEKGALAEIRKWVRRNRAMAATLFLLLVSVIGGLGGIGYVNAAHASELEGKNDDLMDATAVAESERKTAEQIQTFLQDMITIANPSRGFGAQVTVREMMGDASKRLETQFEDDLDLRSNLEQTLASTYFSIGIPDDGERLQLRAIDTRRRFLPEGDWKLARWMINLGDLAGARRFTGPVTAEHTADLLHEAIEICDRVGSDEPALRALAEVAKADLAQAISIRDGLIEERKVPDYMVKGFATFWKLEEEQTRERLEQLVLQLEQAWNDGGAAAAAIALRPELEPYMDNVFLRNNIPSGLERLSEWAESARRNEVASALRACAVDFLRTEKGFKTYDMWASWRQYSALLVRTRQWKVALPEAKACVQFGDEQYPNDMAGRLESHHALVSAMRGAGTKTGFKDALNARLEIARRAHAEGANAPIAALIELAEESGKEDAAVARELLLEAWGHLELLPAENEDLRGACALMLLRLYEAAGTPEEAEPYRAWVEIRSANSK
ncbi:MAG: serine/threonine protein kinase [bacterium]|nr:serine/threonine protein kinase [bacterium]